MTKRINLFVLFLILTATLGFSQEKKKYAVYAGGFYNLENLFDTDDDPNNRGDDEFTPEGSYNWTEQKYHQKLSNIANVISQLGKDDCPSGLAFLGVSEVENRRVLEDLLKTAPLNKMNLKIIHYDSPDRRGIDVAFLYNPQIFNVTSSTTYPYVLPDNPKYKTRDQLLVSGKLAGENFHVIVCHWPSRYGGGKSNPLREHAASISKHIVDSIMNADPTAKIMITGDFNDDPTDPSCTEVLKAKRYKKDVMPNELFNSTWQLYAKGIGSLCYNGQWNLYDQIIITGTLLGEDNGTLKYWKNQIFNYDFLMEQEGKRKGYPLRTFSGRRFINGYSDHLPSLIYFIKEVKE